MGRRLIHMTLELIPETPVHSGGRPHHITGGKLTGQKPALKMKEVWSIRARLELRKRVLVFAGLGLRFRAKGRADCGEEPWL